MSTASKSIKCIGFFLFWIASQAQPLTEFPNRLEVLADTESSIVGLSSEAYGIVGITGGFGTNNGYLTAGGYFTSYFATPDIILGNSPFFSGDCGTIRSDPAVLSSDLQFISNDNVYIDLDQNDESEIGTFEIRKNGEPVFLMNENGLGYVTGGIIELSDRSRKTNIEEANPQKILEALRQVPIYGWTYNQDTIPHLGPMAQDFYQAFGLGLDGKGIFNLDANGVALAAIQALYDQNMRQDQLIKKLEKKLALWKDEISDPTIRKTQQDKRR